MKSKSKKILKEILTDWKHWFGWLLTTGALILVFSFLPSEFMQSYIKIGLTTFSVIVIVDIFKHIWGLQ
ncbi:MAG: hypothetical protein KKF48_02795 [Nanoarchaeota archaeon]|nr:hypothetical protein [Nanoarchaeota archaeon]MBU1027950.1 hypothetical protein [Nanoarchaeota archaeon]